MDLDIETPDVTLTNPVYNVTHIKLISARLPNTQLLINQYNNTFVYNSTTYSVPLGTYTTGEALASAFGQSGSGIVATYDSNTNSMSYTDTFEPNPWLETILSVDLTGPRYITIRMTVGSDVLTRSVYPKGTECHYLGKVLTGSIGDIIHFTDTLDTIEMVTQLKSIQTIHLDFLNPDGSVYDFGGRNYILKFRLECLTDKMNGTKGDVVTQYALPPPVSWSFGSDNNYIMIGAIVLLVLGLLILMSRPQAVTA